MVGRFSVSSGRPVRELFPLNIEVVGSNPGGGMYLRLKFQS